MRTLEFIRKYLDRAAAEGRLHDLVLREKDAAVVAELARLDSLDTLRAQRERDQADARAWREKVEPHMSPAFIRRGSFADHAEQFPEPKSIDIELVFAAEPTSPAAALPEQDDPKTPAYLRAALAEVERLNR